MTSPVSVWMRMRSCIANLKIGANFVFVAGIFAVPVSEKSFFHQEEFSGIPSNKVNFSINGIEIKVDSSASPLVFPILPPKKITGFTVTGEFKGLPRIQNTERQGQKGADDFPLRIGFVAAGANRPNLLQRAFAPSWLRNLYSIISKESGISVVRFYNVTQNQKALGQTRQHPSSELITEEYFALQTNVGKFDFTKTFDLPIEVLAVWISVDGDDTKSKYEVLISSLSLKYEGP